jgi:predicted metal-dependent hydrolase
MAWIFRAQPSQLGIGYWVFSTVFGPPSSVLLELTPVKGESENITPEEKAALVRKAIAQFNAGDYFDQHETFEHVWRHTPSPERDVYQAILQVGVAYLHITNKNWDGAKKVLDRAIPKLQKLPDEHAGMNLAQLCADALAVRQELAKGAALARPDVFDERLLKPIVS